MHLSPSFAARLRLFVAALPVAALAAYLYAVASHARGGQTIRCISSPEAHAAFEQLLGPGHKWHMDQNVFFKPTLVFRSEASEFGYRTARTTLERACGVKIAFSPAL